jgi:hypothetical protein
MKPKNLTFVKIEPVNIGIALIKNLEIDLDHINHGLDISKRAYNKKARSSFTEIEIAHIFNQLDGFNLNPSGKIEKYLYFAQEIDFEENNFFLVFCINTNAQQTAGIITLYRI